MYNFGKLFKESKDNFIIYEGKKLVMSDRFPVKNGDVVFVNIEKTNSNLRQGATIDITGWCEINGEKFKQGKGVRMQFWEDTWNKTYPIKIFTKRDYVVVYNICEAKSFYSTFDKQETPLMKSSTTLEYWHNGCAMIVEEIENGRRYRCSDVMPDGNFENIVFTIKKISS